MTETRDTYTARDIPELLDLLPALFGFSPKQSFIAIATHGEHHRFGFRLRMDLPPLEHAQPAAGQIADYLRRQDPDGAVLLAVTDRRTEADALMTAVLANLGDLPVHDAVRTDGERYWSYLRGGSAEGVPYVSQCSPAVVGAIVSGMQILPDREALVARFAPVAGAREKVMAAATDKVLGRALKEIAAAPKADLGNIGMALLRPILDSHPLGRKLTDPECATLAIWVSSKRVRDEVWASIRRDNAVASLELWTEVAQSVVAPFEAPVLCLAAFAAWLCGDGTQALIAAERAVAVEPGYAMARLILGTIENGISPEHWRGFDAGMPTTS